MPDYAQRAAFQQIDAMASDAAAKMALGHIAPNMQGRPIETRGVLAPVQGYQTMDLSQQALLRNAAQHQALMNALLSGSSGRQALLQLG
jgi:hypothetical protein